MKKSAAKTAPKPPPGLSPAAGRFWTALRREYGIADAGGLALLEVAARAWQRAEAARAEIDAEGVVTRDRWGQAKPHPACAVERDARAQVIAALRALNLDLEPTHSRPGRPSSPLGWAGPDEEE